MFSSKSIVHEVFAYISQFVFSIEAYSKGMVSTLMYTFQWWWGETHSKKIVSTLILLFSYDCVRPAPREWSQSQFYFPVTTTWDLLFTVSFQLLLCEALSSLVFCLIITVWVFLLTIFFSFFNHYGMRPSPHSLFLIIMLWGILLTFSFQLLQYETLSSLFIFNSYGVRPSPHCFFNHYGIMSFPQCLLLIIMLRPSPHSLFLNHYDMKPSSHSLFSIIMIWGLLLTFSFQL